MISRIMHHITLVSICYNFLYLLQKIIHFFGPAESYLLKLLKANVHQFLSCQIPAKLAKCHTQICIPCSLQIVVILLLQWHIRKCIFTSQLENLVSKVISVFMEDLYGFVNSSDFDRWIYGMKL